MSTCKKSCMLAVMPVKVPTSPCVRLPASRTIRVCEAGGSSTTTVSIRVCPFTKGDLISMGDNEAQTPGLGKPSPFQMVPLDLRIRHEFDAQPFEVLLVAFDAHPKNQKLGPTPSSP